MGEMRVKSPLAQHRAKRGFIHLHRHEVVAERSIHGSRQVGKTHTIALHYGIGHTDLGLTVVTTS